jgi:hypothetical protein
MQHDCKFNVCVKMMLRQHVQSAWRCNMHCLRRTHEERQVELLVLQLVCKLMRAQTACLGTPVNTKPLRQVNSTAMQLCCGLVTTVHLRPLHM